MRPCGIVTLISGRWRRSHLVDAPHHASGQAMRFAQDIDAGETCRFARSPAQQLVAPGIQQSRADPVPAGDRRQRGVRCKALRHDRLLLLQRPTSPPLAARDHLDPLRASTLTITRMSARVSLRSCRADLRAVRVHHHGARTSRRGAAKQCGGSATLTVPLAEWMVREFGKVRGVSTLPGFSGRCSLHDCWSFDRSLLCSSRWRPTSVHHKTYSDIDVRFVSVCRQPRHWCFIATPEWDYCVQSQGSRTSIFWMG